MRHGNDRSVKTIKFLEQYSKLCAKYDREIDLASDDGGPVLVVTTSTPNAEAMSRIKLTPEQ